MENTLKPRGYLTDLSALVCISLRRYKEPWSSIYEIPDGLRSLGHMKATHHDQQMTIQLEGGQCTFKLESASHQKVVIHSHSVLYSGHVSPEYYLLHFQVRHKPCQAFSAEPIAYNSTVELVSPPRPKLSSQGRSYCDI